MAFSARKLARQAKTERWKRVGVTGRSDACMTLVFSDWRRHSSAAVCLGWVQGTSR
jgi:hypothetical protein